MEGVAVVVVEKGTWITEVAPTMLVVRATIRAHHHTLSRVHTVSFSFHLAIKLSVSE